MIMLEWATGKSKETQHPRLLRRMYNLPVSHAARRRDFHLACMSGNAARCRPTGNRRRADPISNRRRCRTDAVCWWSISFSRDGGQGDAD
jgi:hypothetical protein